MYSDSYFRYKRASNGILFQCHNGRSTPIENNRHRCYTALKFSPPATQSKHRVKRILYSSSVRKCRSLALSCWKLAGIISYRPFCTASAFCCMLSIVFGFTILKRHSNARLHRRHIEKGMLRA